MSAPKYLLVRNRGRDPRAKVLRAARPGMRRTGFLFGDGRRVRRAGKRFSRYELDYCMAHADKLVEGIETGFLEVASDQGKLLSLVEVQALLYGGVAPKKQAPAPKPEPKVEPEAAVEEPPEEPEDEEPEPEAEAKDESVKKTARKRRTK